MRYHYQKPEIYIPVYGKLYACNYPIYNRCTLFVIGKRGLAVIQQRYKDETKETFWSEIDDWLNNDIYVNAHFKSYFDKMSGEKDQNGLYPTVSVRQIMWALKMKPIKRERWETVFDRKLV